MGWVRETPRQRLTEEAPRNGCAEEAEDASWLEKQDSAKDAEPHHMQRRLDTCAPTVRDVPESGLGQSTPGKEEV